MMFHITGKMNRGLMVVVSLCHLVGDRPLTTEEERLSSLWAGVLKWSEMHDSQY